MDGQISLRAIILLIVGLVTGYVAYRNPPLGVAVGIAVVVVALLHELIDKER